MVKYDSIGNVVWIKTIPSEVEQGTFGKGVVLDKEGNIYMIGEFSSKADFDGIILEQSGFRHLFLAKFNNEGEVQWAQKITGGELKDINDLTIDNNGNIYVAGTFIVAARFGDIYATAEDRYATSRDFFVAKYNSAGVVQWVQSAGGIGQDYVLSIEADKQGDVYIAGHFSKSANFRGITRITKVEATGESNMFLAKYNTDGEIQWIETNTGKGLTGVSNMAIDDSNNIYLKGFCADIIQFRKLIFDPKQKSYQFIVKYNAAGVPQWTIPIGANGTYNGKSLKIDKKGNLYTADQLIGQSFLDKEEISADGEEDLIIGKYNKIRKIEWLKTAPFSESCIIHCVSIDKNGRIYVAGMFKGEGNFDGNTKNSLGDYDIFIWRFAQ